MWKVCSAYNAGKEDFTTGRVVAVEFAMLISPEIVEVGVVVLV
tara:strand:- start:167 stop:295 length:129 start_codon:yes stop_codon:yes gene_type:complete